MRQFTRFYKENFGSVSTSDKPTFRAVNVHAHNGCNLACKGCNHNSSVLAVGSSVNVDQMLNDLDNILPRIHIWSHISLLGGEPLLEPRCEEILTKIEELVSYYQVISNVENDKKEDIIIFNIFFDKDKLHNLFYEKDISYAEITDKEFYLLPVLKKDDQYFIFNQNFFYEKWNDFEDNDLVEFILPFENIEIIQKININKNDLFDVEINTLFLEYSKKNQALLLIDDKNGIVEKIFLRANISGKKINKNLLIKNNFKEKAKNYREIIQRTRNEIIDLVKSQNLIDIKTPSFLNIKLTPNKNNNLAELHKRLNNIGLVDDLYVQEINSEYVLLKIKYLGKLEKIINELKKEKIILKQKNDEWSIKLIK